MTRLQECTKGDEELTWFLRHYQDHSPSTWMQRHGCQAIRLPPERLEIKDGITKQR